MPTFKKPAPAPPPSPRLRTPMKSTVKKDLGKSTLVAFDDLMRDGTVFLNDTIYNDFLKFVNFAKVLQRNYRGAEEERKRRMK